MTQNEPLILAVDQGTTSSRALLFNARGEIVDIRQKDLNVFTPQSGWVEQDASQIWDDVHELCSQILNENDHQNIIGMAITNQRETTILWNKKTGKPIFKAIVWQDRRTAKACKPLTKHSAMIQSKTGLIPDPYFSATKIKWILDQYDGDLDDILFGTVDSFLLWHMTGGDVHATDASNAARTMLFNIHDQNWDDDLCDLIGVPKSILPAVHDNLHHFGTSNIFGFDLPILAMAGDQQAATFGQACFEKGMVKSTYGTGCFALMNTGQEAVLSDHRLLSTIAWRMNGTATYALEGSIFVAGAAVQFLRDQFNFVNQSYETEKMARSVKDTDGVVFVPTLTGLGAPYWDANARGAIFGLSRGTKKEHIVRACLDAQAYQTNDLIQAMAADAGHPIDTIRVDGGLSNNNYVCETIANETGCLIDRPKNTEATVWGVSAMAFMQAGVFKTLDDIQNVYALDHQFKPTVSDGEGYASWQRAIKAIQLFHDEDK